jgi:hypothetical protein
MGWNRRVDYAQRRLGVPTAEMLSMADVSRFRHQLFELVNPRMTGNEYLVKHAEKPPLFQR